MLIRLKYGYVVLYLIFLCATAQELHKNDILSNYMKNKNKDGPGKAHGHGHGRNHTHKHRDCKFLGLGCDFFY